MAIRNKASRYHLIIEALRQAARLNPRVQAVANELVSHYEYQLEDHRRYILANGKDPDEIYSIAWSFPRT